MYDGSARFSESHLSLNDCLQTGSNLIPKLFDILIRFHGYHIALTADIEKAFLMIGIHKSDRDMLRFLWFSDPHKEDSEILQLRFTRLVFGLRPSPAILGAVILYHICQYQDKYQGVVNLLERSFYVDDLITGAETVEKAFHFYQLSNSLMSEGGFNLRKWNSNSHSLLAMIRSDQVPRCYFDTKKHPVSIQLHGFSDASKHAYAAVLYLRTLYSDGSVTVSLVASKTKVAPLKKQYIPHLELLGALILARLREVITMTISNITEHFLWVDSMTVLCWIQIDRVWKRYVQHRVDDIRKISDRGVWRHCPGHMNPADLPSRGIVTYDSQFAYVSHNAHILKVPFY